MEIVKRGLEKQTHHNDPSPSLYQEKRQEISQSLHRNKISDITSSPKGSNGIVVTSFGIHESNPDEQKKSLKENKQESLYNSNVTTMIKKQVDESKIEKDIEREVIRRARLMAENIKKKQMEANKILNKPKVHSEHPHKRNGNDMHDSTNKIHHTYDTTY
jgi:Lhr-like helicase